MFDNLFKNNNKTKIYVDFENVKIKGLDGLDELTDKDTLYLFYSKNAETLTIPMFEKIKNSNAKIETIECATGSNAMDFVISTLLGSHVKTDSEKTTYFIVSKDKGYQAVIDYWEGYEIKRIFNLKQVYNDSLEVIDEEEPKKKTNQRRKTTTKIQQKTKQPAKQPKQQPQKKKHKINVRSRIGMLVKGLKKADMDKMETVVKNGSDNTYAKLLNEKFGNKGNDYYTKLKPLFDELKK